MNAFLNIIVRCPLTEAFTLAVLTAFPLWFVINWNNLTGDVMTHIGPQGVLMGSRDDHTISIVACFVVYLLTLRGQIMGGINLPIWAETAEMRVKKARTMNFYARHLLIPLMTALPVFWLVKDNPLMTTLVGSLFIILFALFVLWLVGIGLLKLTLKRRQAPQT